MLAFLGGKFLSPLPGLGVHGGTEPSAHALGYHLPALRAWCGNPDPRPCLIV